VQRLGNNIHSVGVHALADIELVVLEVANDLLGKGVGLGLEVLDLVLTGTLLSKSLLDIAHVLLEVGQVALLIERGRLEAEGIDNVVDLHVGILGTLLGLLGGSVSASVCCTRSRERLAVVLKSVGF